MNWLTNLVRPKIRKWVGKKDVPDNLWHKCPNCNQMIFHRELEANLRVCTHCGHHMRCDARTRLAMLFDDARFVQYAGPRPHSPWSGTPFLAGRKHQSDAENSPIRH